MAEFGAEIDLLHHQFRYEVGVINDTASKHQEALRRQLNRSMEEQEADILVCKIRLEREIERLKQERSGEAMKAGPVMELPVELLSCIFRHYVDSGMSPWKLVKVCKGWMNVAFAIPRLWRYLCITDGGEQNLDKWVVNGRKYYFQGHTQVCQTMAQLQDALHRSGGVVPLEIYVKWSDGKGSTIWKVSPLLSIIIRTPISKRIRHLDLAALPFDQVFPTNIQFGPFNQLTSIRLPRLIERCNRPLLESIDSTSVQLQTVAVSAQLSPDLANYSFWSRIKRLELEGYWHKPGHTRGLDQIVKRLANLEDISNCQPFWPTEHTPISTWERIKEINLTCNPKSLDRLRLPNLEIFTFIDTTSRMDIPDDIPVLSYPKLTTIAINTHDPRWFSNLSAPLLTNLTLVWIVYESLPQDHVPIRISDNLLSHIASIKLQTPRYQGDVAVISALESAPNLRKIDILGRHSDPTFGLELLKRLDASQKPVLCPELESLSFGTHSDSIYTLKKNGLPLIKRVVTSRKKAGMPLREFLVCWQKTRDVVEDYAK